MSESDEDRNEALARRRVEENPTDLALRFELGRCLLAMRRYKEAILELQRARQHPQYRKQAMQLLAHSFEALGYSDKAGQAKTQLESEDFGDEDDENGLGGAGQAAPLKPIKPVDGSAGKRIPESDEGI